MPTPLSGSELDKDREPHLLPLFIVFTILPLAAVTLRVLARKTKRMSLWWDDYLILVASAFVIAQLAFLAEALAHGLGKHYTFLSELYYATDITLIKCSILCLYLRLFGVDRKFSILCYGMIAFVVAWGIAVILVTIFQCKPVEAGWNKAIPGEQCFNLEHFLIGTNVPNIIADAAIIALPIPQVWKLQLSRMRKVGLVGIFLLAALTTIISIVRVNFNAHIDVTDPTWNFVKVAILSTVEVSVGVCCACMPVIYPLLRILVGNKNKPSKESSSAAEAGYRKDTSRPRHHFSQLDERWNSNSNSNSNSNPRGGYEDIPMGRIKVTQNLCVEHMGVT
ncbi:MAG: hypothetical protein Q9195_008729 [Heterodermia aff. obscurata]